MCDKIKIIAHRGASALARHENTLEAFEIAVQTGADMAEFDIRKTSDDVMVVFHDACIEGRRIGEITYASINEIAADKGYRVPTLDEVLDLCRGRIHLDIELKESGYERRVVKAVKRRYSYNEYSMKSFDREVVKNIKIIDKNIKTGLLVGKEKASFVERFREYFPEKSIRALGCDFVSPYYKMATRGFLYRMKKKHIEVYPWTVNKERKMQYFLGKSIAGIITDRPDRAIEIYGRND